MKNTHLLGLMLVAGLAFTGCGKDDDDSGNTPTQNKTQMLTAKNYKLTGYTIQGQNVFNTPGYLDACDKDDLHKFNTNMTYVRTDAGDTCGNNASGNWAFLGNESQLRLIVGGDTTIETITQLDASTLKLSSVDSLGGMAITNVATFTAQ